VINVADLLTIKFCWKVTQGEKSTALISKLLGGEFSVSTNSGYIWKHM